MSFDNNKDKLTKHEFIKEFSNTIDNIYTHTKDKDRHITQADRERWNNNSKTIPEYPGIGSSFFSQSAREKLAAIDENANNYIHPTGNMVPGKYLEVHFDEYGHVNYANNPAKITAKVNNAMTLNKTQSSGFLYVDGTNFPKKPLINASYLTMTDRSTASLEYLMNKTLDKAYTLGNSEIISTDETNKIYINTDTDNAYFFDGKEWVLIGGNNTVKLDKDGFIPSKYIPSDSSFEQPVGEIAMCMSKRPPKGWVSLDGSLYFRKDLPDLWEYAQTQGLVVSDDKWKTLYKNKLNNTNYNIAAGLFSSGDGVNTFRVPAFFGEPLYTNTLGDVGKTKNFTVKHLQGNIQAFYDYTKTDNLTYGNFKTGELNETTSKMPTIHPGRDEALSNGITYKNIKSSKSNILFPSDSKINLNGFVTLKPSNSVPVANEFRPRQVYTNFIIKACQLEENFPDNLYKAKTINNKLDLTSYAVDVFNQNIIYGYESLGEYVASHLYLKRIILDLSHWKTGVVDFLDTPYSLYSFIFSDIKVEFTDLSGISSVNYPFNISNNEEFLQKLICDEFITEEYEIGDEYKTSAGDPDTTVDEDGNTITLKERPVIPIRNKETTSNLMVSISPLFPTEREKIYIDYLQYQVHPRENTSLDIKYIYGNQYNDSYNIQVSKK